MLCAEQTSISVPKEHLRTAYTYSDDINVCRIADDGHNIIHSSPHGQNGRRFADDTIKYIYEKFCILIPISMKLIPKDQINNKSAFVHVMAWCNGLGEEPLSETMLTWFTYVYMQH